MTRLSKYLVSLWGEYAVACELVKKGYTVALTSRNAAEADMVVSNEECSGACTIQVKATTSETFWNVAKKSYSSPTHIYVFVRFDDDSEDAEAHYFIVPSEVVHRVKRLPKDPTKTRPWVNRTKVRQYEDRWDILLKKVNP